MLTETEGLARNALAEARRSILGLQPTPLQHQSLQEALRPELGRLAKRARLVTHYYLQDKGHPLAPAVAIALFRIAQEAFHNIEKHAAARHVILGLTIGADAAILTVEDDGAGFAAPPTTANGTNSYGLLSMAARARSLGGELVVTSHPAHGTTVPRNDPLRVPGLCFSSDRTA